MSTSVCPRCYKPMTFMPPGGTVRCEACGHSFPAAAATAAYDQIPPSYGNPLSPYPPVGAPPHPYATPYTMQPPAGGPRNPGNPGLMACGVVSLLGLTMLVCCGAGGAIFFVRQHAAQRELQGAFENEIGPAGFQPATVAPPDYQSPSFQPPNYQPPRFEPPPMYFPQPIPPPPLNPYLPSTLPGGSAERLDSLDNVLTAIKAASPNNFSAVELLNRLRDTSIIEERRGEVVQTVLAFLANASPIAMGSSQQALEKWASAAQSQQLAAFVASEAHPLLRMAMARVIASVGGDAEAAKTLVAKLDDFHVSFAVKDALVKIGPSAEDAVLARLDDTDQRTKRLVYDVLGEVGGAKAQAQLEPIAEAGVGLDAIFARQALDAIKRRQ